MIVQKKTAVVITLTAQEAIDISDTITKIYENMVRTNNFEDGTDKIIGLKNNIVIALNSKDL